MIRLALHIFPILQVACFVSGVLLFPDHWGIALILVGLSALFLNFSLHITVHHFVHFSFQNKILNRCFEAIYTILIGLPFNFYRMQHFNHHRYDNALGDFTSTWKQRRGKIVPQSFIGYCFFWFIGGSVTNAIKRAREDEDLPENRRILLQAETLLIVLFYGVLLLLNPILALAYLIMFYLGWSMIAITNYGQHLPLKYGKPIAYSYRNKLYNSLFFNNGLHLEHHKHPGVDYLDLKPEKDAKIKAPHMLAGLMYKTK